MPFTRFFTHSEFISTSQFSHHHFCQDLVAAFCELLSWILGIPWECAPLFHCCLLASWRVAVVGKWTASRQSRAMDWRLASRIGHLPLQIFIVSLTCVDFVLEVEQLLLRCQELSSQQSSPRDGAFSHRADFKQWRSLERGRLLTKHGGVGRAGNVLTHDLALLDLLLKFAMGFEQLGTFGLLRSCQAMDQGHQKKVDSN